MEFKLIIKKLNNTLTEEEDSMFSDWYRESPNHRLYFNRVKENYTKDIDLVNEEKAWNSLSKKISKKPRSIFNWNYAIAAIVIVLLAIPFLIKTKSKASPKNAQISNSIILPGTDKAKLTLEDGSEILLGEGALYKGNSMVSNGREITYIASESHSKEIVYNYLTVPRGGQFFVKLADGTQVWLNSESQLKYPVNFIDRETRHVELVYGEAYFDVSPSTDHEGAKFSVLTNHQVVEVLGTEFNIKAYSNETFVYTTLVEGRVAITNSNGSMQTVLSPNQQSIIKPNQAGIEVINTDVFNETSWKQGIFSFDHMTLEDIMKVLSRWYSVDVIFTNPNIQTITFNGVLRKNQNIEDILKPITSINNITYEIKDSKIIFK